ncbi:6-carboxytetrahydropterin synthase [Planctomycetota bacterium]
MLSLSRNVRFCVDPLGGDSPTGTNNYAASPGGQGLCFFLELGVRLRGALDPETGFVVNVTDIDNAVRQAIVPVVTDRVNNRLGRRRPVGVPQLIELLVLSQRLLQRRFKAATLTQVTLHLTPYRALTLRTEDTLMAYFSERFEFAAMHKLWNDRFSEEKNFEVFGKCANPAGHGHNYVIEVTVKVTNDQDIDMHGFEKVVYERLINLLDHKSLNVDIEHFKTVNPTMENIAKFSWDRLNGQLEPALLHDVTVWESDRTSCSYRGPDG